MKKQEWDKIANEICINIDNKCYELLEQTWNTLKPKIKFLKKIKTDNVLASDYCFNNSHHELNDDIPSGTESDFIKEYKVPNK